MVYGVLAENTPSSPLICLAARLQKLKLSTSVVIVVLPPLTSLSCFHQEQHKLQS